MTLRVFATSDPMRQDDRRILPLSASQDPYWELKDRRDRYARMMRQVVFWSIVTAAALFAVRELIATARGVW